MTQLRSYERYGRVVVLGSFAGGHSIATEEIDGLLCFFVDAERVFEIAKGRNDWTLYDGRA